MYNSVVNWCKTQNVMTNQKKMFLWHLAAANLPKRLMLGTGDLVTSWWRNQPIYQNQYVGLVGTAEINCDLRESCLKGEMIVSSTAGTLYTWITFNWNREQMWIIVTNQSKQVTQNKLSVWLWQKVCTQQEGNQWDIGTTTGTQSHKLHLDN